MALTRPRRDEQPPSAGPYLEITDLAYGAHVAETFEVEQPQSRTLVLRGRCPRCDHPMEFLVTDQVVKRWRRSNPQDEPPPPPGSDDRTAEEPMVCTCEGDHAGRPEGYLGCGAYWNVKISQA
ncbi:hypothetical protein [Frankia sp. QA3]|uniref:hypothetical protein n=1 Tax=Frankia sp. QA3 TaxID=710111 RepID=UPI000269BC49|nr:hypothetical protein [Frankia sp. QA3]EIV91770.1 hypothetical protein FraQA3DRAFT_1248 [Frankia sp. QA3]